MPRPTPRAPFAALAALMTALSLLAGPVAVADEAQRRSDGGDLFVGGRSVGVDEPVAGDLFAAGGRVDLRARVGGDAVVMGGQVKLRGEVADSVYAAGGQIEIAGPIRGSLRVAGGQVELLPGAEVDGNVLVAGGQLRLQGKVAGHVRLAGGDVLIDGPVGGNVTAGSGQLRLGPNARIGGRLSYRSAEALVQDPQAQVAGGVESLPMPMRHEARGERERDGDRGQHRGFGGFGAFGIAGSIAWTLGLMLVAGVLVAALPGWTARVSAVLRERGPASLGLGFVLLVCVPVAFVILAVTVIGLPLALLLLALYVALLPLAYVAAAVGLGDAALARWRPAALAHRGWRFGAACVVLLLLAWLGWIPWLGGLLLLLVMLAGLGALVLQLSRKAPSGLAG